MAAQKKQLSLDTNVVFDLAEGKDFARDFLEIFQGRGYSLLVPPTMVHELHVIFTHGESDVERELTRKVLASLIEWGMRPFDLDSVAAANQGRTPLHDAAECGWQDIVELLVAGNADLNARDNKGETPLFLADANGKNNWTSKKVAEWIRDHGGHD